MRRSFNGTYPITREYGFVNCTDYGNYPGCKHPGTDYGLPANVQLVGGMSGEVTQVYKRSTGRGWEVVIKNGNKERKTLHMNRIDVTVGQKVTEGQVIGLSGETGYVFGAHLHDELLIDGQYVNLEDNLKQGEDMEVNDGDIINAKRAETGVPDYQPTGAEFDYYKSPEHGFKDLMYDTIKGMQAQVDRLKAQATASYEPVNEQLYKKK